MDWMRWKALRKWMDTDRLLGRVGLERSSAAGDLAAGLGFFAVGVLVGAGLGLMFAPRRGEELRQAVGEAWRRGRTGGMEEVQQMGAEAGMPPTTGH